MEFTKVCPDCKGAGETLTEEATEWRQKHLDAMDVYLRNVNCSNETEKRDALMEMLLEKAPPIEETGANFCNPCNGRGHILTGDAETFLDAIKAGLIGEVVKTVLGRIRLSDGDDY